MARGVVVIALAPKPNLFNDDDDDNNDDNDNAFVSPLLTLPSLQNGGRCPPVSKNWEGRGGGRGSDGMGAA